MKRTSMWLLAAVLAAAQPSPLPAQDAGGEGSLSPVALPGPARRPALVAGSLPAPGIAIDGRLDEVAWASAPLASGFIQAEPLEGTPARDDTHVRVLVADDALYVAARLHDSDPAAIVDRLVRRDEEGLYDWFSVQLDPNRDQRTAYVFRVSASNVQRDEYVYDDSRADDAWDAVWESAVATDELGWSVEIRIPLSQLRFQTSDSLQTWGVNFVRRRVASAELSYFSLKSRLREGRVSQFGTLEQVSVRRGARRIEARPYLLSSVHAGPAVPGDPFFDGRDLTSRVGTDLRFGLGSAFTLDATVNPDFGQVEADPAVINLSDVETFTSERRPFFVEDARILDFTLSGRTNRLFHSRRIGRSPQGGAPSGSSFIDVPDATAILGAAKLTGRTVGGLSVGALAAVTERERGLAQMEAGEDPVSFVVEPETRYGVVSLQQDLNGGLTQVGGIVTALDRVLPADGAFDFLPANAYSAGLRFEHQWSERRWALSGFVAGSHVRGDSTALIRIQRASNHYYQRPDARRERLDSTATSLTGLEWRLQLERQNGRHWTGGVWLGQVTSGFEVNDLGYSGSSERLDGGFRIGYRELQPGSLFRSYNVNFFSFHNVSHDALDEVGSWDSWRRAYLRGSFSLNKRFEFLNYWGLNSDLSVSPDGYSRTATRGGPVMLDPGSARWNVRFNTDGRKAVSFGGSVNLRQGFHDSGGEVGVGGEIQVRPAPRVELRLEPRWSVQTDGAQYVTATSTSPWEPTFGRRYFFAEIERATLSMETRVNVSLSPSLTFQLYAQPLVSSGDYVRYRQLAAAGEFGFLDFLPGEYQEDLEGPRCVGGTICRESVEDGAARQHVDFDGDGAPDFAFTDRDFNVRSLVGNAVLRWEYRPGSTIFLVWQRQQRGRADVGDFALGRDLAALWDVPADNVFMLKVSYWLGL